MSDSLAEGNNEAVSVAVGRGHEEGFVKYRILIAFQSVRLQKIELVWTFLQFDTALHSFRVKLT